MDKFLTILLLAILMSFAALHAAKPENYLFDISSSMTEKEFLANNPYAADGSFDRYLALNKVKPIDFDFATMSIIQTSKKFDSNDTPILSDAKKTDIFVKNNSIKIIEHQPLEDDPSIDDWVQPPGSISDYSSNLVTNPGFYLILANVLLLMIYFQYKMIKQH